MVQCGSCGTMETIPYGEVKKSINHSSKISFKTQPVRQKVQKIKKVKKTAPKNQEKLVCTHQNIWQKAWY